MSSKSFIAIILMLILGCQSLESPEKPSTLLEEDCMVDILTQIALLKAAKGSFKKKMEIEKINPEAYILSAYGIDSTTFAENNAWYASDLENYERIFKEVKSTIEWEFKGVSAQIKIRDSIKKVNDSIKKAKKDSLKAKKDKPSSIKPVKNGSYKSYPTKSKNDGR